MKTRLERQMERLAEVRRLARVAGLEVRSVSHTHVRVCGPTPMDYWPGSSRAWPYGGRAGSQPMTPAEVVAASLAIPTRRARRSNLPAGAEQHMRALK